MDGCLFFFKGMKIVEALENMLLMLSCQYCSMLNDTCNTTYIRNTSTHTAYRQYIVYVHVYRCGRESVNPNSNNEAWRPENLAPWWVVFWLAIPEQLQVCRVGFQEGGW